MEDASAVDLDWFWRGWFFTTEHVDISLENVAHFQLNTNDPSVEKALEAKKNAEKDAFIGDERNKTSIKQTVNEADKSIDDFYANHDKYKVDNLHKKEYEEFKAKLSKEDLELLNSNKQFYELKFKNIGGLVSPIIIRATFEDGTEEIIRIPAEIWRRDEEVVSRVFIFDKQVKTFLVDPFLETADCDLDNNSWPQESQATRYQLFQQAKSKENLMQRQKRVE